MSLLCTHVFINCGFQDFYYDESCNHGDTVSSVCTGAHDALRGSLASGMCQWGSRIGPIANTSGALGEFERGRSNVLPH